MLKCWNSWVVYPLNPYDVNPMLTYPGLEQLGVDRAPRLSIHVHLQYIAWLHNAHPKA